MFKRTDFGVYLGEEGEGFDRDRDTRVLLPAKQVPPGLEKGGRVEVFLYRDSKDRLIATTRTPLITLGEIAELRVNQVTKIGAFLDWGLEKDLFLPYREQTIPVREKKTYPVLLYEDKTHRLAATMKLYHHLSKDHDYSRDDHVEGVVYEVVPDRGAYVAVDLKYSAMIPDRELHKKLFPGDHVKARVTKVLPDGKLELALHEKAYLQMDSDAARIMDVIESYDGVLPFNDKASPERIAEEFDMSKAEFKRAVGRLLKGNRIIITKDSIVKRTQDMKPARPETHRKKRKQG